MIIRLGLILSTALTIAGQSCSEVAPKTKVPTGQEVSYDTSYIAVFQFDFRSPWTFDSTFTSATLSAGDFRKIDSVLGVAISGYNAGLDSKLLKHYGLDTTDSRYKRQYMPAKDTKGDKFVWLNFLCEAHNFDWKKGIIVLDDGGKCCFNVIINLSKGPSSGMMVNGYAIRAEGRQTISSLY